MKKIICLFLMVSLAFKAPAQTTKHTFTYDGFEKQILDYQPKQNDLSEKSYQHGLMILNEVKKDVENNPANFNRADYFNILSSFLSLNESEQHIKMAFKKFKASDGSCEYFLSKGLFKAEKYGPLRDQIEHQISVCTNADLKTTPINLKEYAANNAVDYHLLILIDKISQLDKKYREEETVNWSKQKLLDLDNQKAIDSLYHAHQKYIGNTLVGKKYNHVMWSVIQHSSLEQMEKYLPIIHQAVQEKELELTPLKMLLDRYYGLKHGYQLFGSQSGFGFRMASDQEKQEVKAKYGID